MDDRIEQTIAIHAPLERVWELVSEPGWQAHKDNTGGWELELTGLRERAEA
jgi:hypothetical protein